jgi:hypothetical protein
VIETLRRTATSRLSTGTQTCCFRLDARREPEALALLDPVQRKSASQVFEGQIRRLASVDDSLHDVRGEKGTIQNPRDITLV